MSEPTENVESQDQPLAVGGDMPVSAAEAEDATAVAGAEDATAGVDDASAAGVEGAAVSGEGDIEEPAAGVVTDDANEQGGQSKGMNAMDGGFDLRDFAGVGSGVGAASETVGGGRLERILRLEVPVIVKVAEKQLPLGDVVNLSPGSIIEFSRSSDQPLELHVNNKMIGQGAAVKVGEKFGLRITRIVPVAEKIRSLGG